MSSDAKSTMKYNARSCRSSREKHCEDNAGNAPTQSSFFSPRMAAGCENCAETNNSKLAPNELQE